MKVKEVLAWVDEVKPNAFSDGVKIGWISRLEETLALEVFLMAPTEAAMLRCGVEDLETELLVDAPYDDLYTLWLAAKIDEANGEYNKYQNSMTAYNARRADFVCWFCQLYDPVQGYRSEEARREYV